MRKRSVKTMLTAFIALVFGMVSIPGAGHQVLCRSHGTGIRIEKAHVAHCCDDGHATALLSRSRYRTDDGCGTCLDETFTLHHHQAPRPVSVRGSQTPQAVLPLPARVQSLLIIAAVPGAVRRGPAPHYDPLCTVLRT